MPDSCSTFGCRPATGETAGRGLLVNSGSLSSFGGGNHKKLLVIDEFSNFGISISSTRLLLPTLQWISFSGYSTRSSLTFEAERAAVSVCLALAQIKSDQGVPLFGKANRKGNKTKTRDPRIPATDFRNPSGTNSHAHPHPYPTSKAPFYDNPESTALLAWDSRTWFSQQSKKQRRRAGCCIRFVDHM